MENICNKKLLPPFENLTIAVDFRLCMFWGRQISSSFHISAYCVRIWKKNAKQQYTHHVRLNSNYIIACLFVHGGQRKSEIVILYYVYTCFRRCCKKKKKNIDFVVYFSMTLFIHFFFGLCPSRMNVKTMTSETTKE